MLPAGTFTFAGRRYEYFHHWYGKTYLIERVVEIPIISQAVFSENGRILEVGNCLSHFYNVQHDVIDKYEVASNVENVDVVDYDPIEKYDLIVSISTLEHVGLDESDKEPGKSVRAIGRLVNCLNPGGRLLFTFPLGWNHELDAFVRSHAVRFESIRVMRRISHFSNRWIEVDLSAASNARYGHPYRGGTWIVFATVTDGTAGW
jgi:hypothetical protein